MLGLLLTVLLTGMPPLVAVVGRLAVAAVAGREALLGATGARNELAGLCAVAAAVVLVVNVAAGTAVARLVLSVFC